MFRIAKHTADALLMALQKAVDEAQAKGVSTRIEIMQTGFLGYNPKRIVIQAKPEKKGR